jgi:hypothetical protein
LYRQNDADILILNDFDLNDYSKQKHGGFALASFQNIGFDHIWGTISIVATAGTGERLMVGKTADMFATLVAAGILPLWDGTY